MSPAKARPRVIVRVADGLGNQLFAYAAARRMALANGAELVIDDVTGFTRDRRFRRAYALDHFNISARKASPAERFGRWGGLGRPLSRGLARLRPLQARSYLEQEHSDFDARVLDVRVRGSLTMDGYWQSEGYFKDVSATIRKDLAIAAPRDALNRRMAARMRAGRSVAVHVRRFDPPGAAGGRNLPAEYYARAVGFMERRVPAARYFLFSDDPEAARAALRVPAGRLTCVAHNRGDASAYADLWLMTRCRHSIIANSTFSWWGAWLGGDAGPRAVVAPSSRVYAGLAGWGVRGLVPDRWTEL